MYRYEYKNAIVYITKPNQEHIVNIKKATKVFLKQVVKEEIQNGCNRCNKRTRNKNSNTRKANRSVK